MLESRFGIEFDGDRDTIPVAGMNDILHQLDKSPTLRRDSTTESGEKCCKTNFDHAVTNPPSSGDAVETWVKGLLL